MKQSYDRYPPFQANDNRDSELMTYEEAARRLHVAEITLRKWVSQRRVPYVKLGRTVRFDPIALEQWIEKMTVQEGAE